MLSLDTRINLLARLGAYILSDNEEWIEIKERAVSANAWFTPAHIDFAIAHIATEYLQKEKLEAWIAQYQGEPAFSGPTNEGVKLVGIVMAGNIPLVGFHDFLCAFISGHNLLIKLSSKDEILLKHLIYKLTEWDAAVGEQVHIADQLKNCNAYIATGSNNTARYFEQYFGKYPHIIRKNRTSVAVLDGNETEDDLDKLTTDVFMYFGLGCRNVTQVCVPEGYDFTRLLDVFSKDKYLINHNKYKNNYDYYLAIYLLNRVPYLTNGFLLMVENALPFSAVSVLHYRYYESKQGLVHALENNDEIQCIVGNGYTPFGTAQQPALNDYADGVDTMQFLIGL
jgi:hypothetical protein